MKLKSRINLDSPNFGEAFTDEDLKILKNFYPPVKVRTEAEIKRKIFWLNKEIPRIEKRAKEAKTKIVQDYFLQDWHEKNAMLSALIWCLSARDIIL